MNNIGNIEFIVRGKIGDADISLSNISLSLLDSFTKDISELLNSIPELKKEEVVVSIEESSLKIKTLLALIALNTFQVDFETLNATNNLDSINNKRSNIIEEWIRKTKSYDNLEFEVRIGDDKIYKFNSNTNYNRNQPELWVESEIYIYGEVTDLGGASKSNIHIKQENGNTIVVNCTKDDLSNEKENKIYHNVALHVSAKQNIATGEIKDANFIQFIEYNPVLDEKQLSELNEKGRKAWEDIVDHVDWIRKLRSEDE